MGCNPTEEVSSTSNEIIVIIMDKFIAKKGKYYLNGKLLDPKEDKKIIEKYLKDASKAICEYEELAMLNMLG